MVPLQKKAEIVLHTESTTVFGTYESNCMHTHTRLLAVVAVAVFDK